MRTNDPDLKPPVERDRDMSLNYKNSATAASPDALEKAVSSLESVLRDASPAVADSFASSAESRYLEPARAGWHTPGSLDDDIARLKDIRSLFETNLKKFKSVLSDADPDDVIRIVSEAWPNGKPSKWADRAAIIGALEGAIDSAKVPESVKVPALHGDFSDAIRDKKLLRRLVRSSKSGKTRPPDEETLAQMAYLGSALRAVSRNPESLDAARLSKDAKASVEALSSQINELQELDEIMDSWHSAMSSFGSAKGGVSEISGLKDLDKIARDIDDFLDDSKTVDPSKYMAELEDYARSNFKDLPPEVEGMFEGFKRAAASNEMLTIGAMADRVATYHGVLDQSGHPTNPTNTGYRSYDRRHFDESHYASIIKTAQKLLDEDWLKYGWEGGAEDVPIRAALDLSIHLADSSLYQSKIDVETYNMLLNRLAGWGHDTFSDTVLPMKAVPKSKRSAADMTNKGYSNIVRIASDLRKTDPQAALGILKNLREMVSTTSTSQTIREHVALDPVGPEPGPMSGDHSGNAGPETPPPAPPEENTAAVPGDVMEFKSMSEGDFEKMKKDIKGEVEKLFTIDDVEDFMEGFEGIMDELSKKTASYIGSNVPVEVLVRLARTNPEAKTILGPWIVAAKKKKDKKKGKKDKKKGKGKAKGKMPEGMAPPFGGPPGKKSKVAVSAEDANW